MKKVAAAICVLALAVMLHPVIHSVNTHSVNPFADGGAPKPPWPEPAADLLLADGGAPKPPWPAA